MFGLSPIFHRSVCRLFSTDVRTSLILGGSDEISATAYACRACRCGWYNRPVTLPGPSTSDNDHRHRRHSITTASSKAMFAFRSLAYREQMARHLTSYEVGET
ncbi:hypothetical protein NP493_99g00000 [Ridgeia piscesae]|uniref:Uncharacterized protein n=1 Tax=Ridgeia piscesae TaxID=27915 RepID=A0AAD9UHG0_RIDPI|nr:hypothetical protein NP493_99g00000 [Ridgeia piscesae]